MTETGAFASRMTRSPRALEAELGRDAAACFPDQPPDIRSLLEGTAGSSPYLKSLIERERDWLDAALTAAPEEVFDTVLREVDTPDVAQLPGRLRQAKRRVALLVGLADLAGVWALEEVTGALTRFADLSVDRAIRVLVGREIGRGRLPGMTEADAATGAGMVAIAMGKMGAGELNYSSDIDLICLFDETRYAPDDFQDARSILVRVTRQVAAMLSDTTGEGYVFRTDLRLRPDPAVTPVCLSMDAAERYYESVGRTWERAAYIKARPAGGDIAAGERFLERLSPFVFRRHLDYAAIQDAHDMRLRIREHKALGGKLRLENHDLKLGSGGIREIEFYTQTRQIIAAGRDPSLRLRGTVDALNALAAMGWTDDAEVLIADYRAHREVEHRLQMVADQQTHSLPSSEEGFTRIAALMGRDVDELRAELLERIKRVADITEGFFAPGDARAAPELSAASAEIVARWPNYPALRSARAAGIFKRVRPEILTRLQERAARPEEALVHFDGFLAGLPAGVQLFSMFEANPQLIDLIVDIAATSPALASYLARHSAVFDAVIGGDFFSEWPGVATLSGQLTGILAAADDYEAKLLAARHWRNEWHFRVGVHHLLGLSNGDAAGAHYADIATALLSAIWDPVVVEFGRKHGTPPGRGGAVLGMGSLGAGALTATSDLDLIVIYDPDGIEVSEGRRPLPARSYFARLTQAFVTALTAQMGPGRLYEVDMRLRPSGRQGPVATSLTSFTNYQRDEAWTWEHLALTRARPVAGSQALGDEIEAFRQELFTPVRNKEATVRDVGQMRARLAEARPGGEAWNVKDGPGRLQDIALFAQCGALLAGSHDRTVAGQLLDGAGALDVSEDEATSLSDAYRLLWRVQAAERLMSGERFDPGAVGSGGHAFLLRETGVEDMAALENALRATVDRAAAIIDTRLAECAGEDEAASDD